MANKTSNGKLRTALLQIFSIIMVICLSAFVFTACGETPTSTSTPTYTKTETDNGIVSNASFEFGSSALKLTDYPQTSPQNWSITTDNSARSSAVSSGIVDVSADAWNQLLDKLYDDDDFYKYIVNKHSLDVADIKTAQNLTTDEEVKEYIIENYVTSTFSNPSTHDAAEGNKLLMINNYLESARYGLGTAQKATSSSSVIIKKGKSAKFSVWVKTANIVGNGKYGANIRVNTLVNSVSTNVFGIYGIVADVWTQYSFYVQADKNFDTTVSLVLGLGFGSNKGSDITTDYTEGTAYFDDITYEDVSTLPTTNTEIATVELKDNQPVLYKVTDISGKDLIFNIDVISAFMSAEGSDVDFTTLTYSYDFYNSNYQTQGGSPVTSQTILDSASNKGTAPTTPSANEISIVGIENAATAITLKNDTLFSVEPESYAFITLNITNKLGRMDKNGISVYIYDTYNGEEIVTSVGNVAYTDGNATAFSFIVKNNFPEKDPDGIYEDFATRKFYIKFIIGPTAISSASTIADFSSGDVAISDMKIATGKLYQYDRDDYEFNGSNIKNYQTTNTENADYNYFTFVSSAFSSNTVALYAGNSADFTATNDSFSMTYAPSEIGTITSAPTAVNGYVGIESNHVYVSDSDDAVADINTRTNNKKYADGHAGVINTKYLDAYDGLSGLSNIADELNYTVIDNKHIQPLLIYNNTESAYGFIGSSLSVSASSFASVTLDIRVTGDAKAFIYLVDVSGANKGVMTIDFTSNTDGYDYVDGNTATSKKLSFEGITADMMDETGKNKGWLTLTFYFATGNTAKNFRLEMWNGSRDGSVTSQGYVFINNVTVKTSSAFNEPAEWTNAFTSTDSILYNAFIKDSSIMDNAILYKRVLDETEIKFNNEQSDASKKKTYAANYAWANNDSTIYAVYSAIDPVAIDPYESETENEDTNAGSGCQAQTDPSSFWLSFSSILLVVVLVFALIMLIIKHTLRKRKKDKKGKKGGYNVSSRYTASKQEKAKKTAKEIKIDEYEDEVIEEQPEEEQSDVEPSEAETTEQTDDASTTEEPSTSDMTLDEFVYGEVQDFGETEDNSDKPE